MLFLLFFSIIVSCFLVPTIIAHIVNPIEKLSMPKWIPKKEAKAEIEPNQVTLKAKINSCSI